MANSIQELTDKIYHEGIAKAQAEAEVILAEAKKEAAAIVHTAHQAKDEIIRQADREANEISRKVHSEIRLAAQKLMSNLKQTIAETLISKQLGSLVQHAFNNEAFVEEMMLAIVRSWAKQDAEKPELMVFVSPKDKTKIDEFFKSRLVAELNHGIEISPEPNLHSGFKIGPKNGNYVISFTEKDFENFFRSYLKETTWELIFGSGQDE